MSQAPAEQNQAPEKTLTLEQRVETQKAAFALGKSELRKKNEKEKTVELELLGHPSLVAGNNVKLEGYGQWDGVYAITEAHHVLNPGYTVRLTLRKV